MIRVLVADDSVMIRALVSQILRGDPDLQIAGEARDGAEAVEMTRALKPDVITMDIMMPRLDGFGATKEIMVSCPTPIVIVSALEGISEAEAAARALSVGALTVLKKPVGFKSPSFAAEARTLLTTVKSMAEVKVVRHMSAAVPKAQACSGAAKGVAPANFQSAEPLVAIATSTGGPEALQALLPMLPPSFAAPVLVVQHITPGFIEGLARHLDSVCPIRVKLAEEGEPLLAGTVYVAPDNFHLGASSQRTVILSAAPPVGGFRPSATFLFETLAQSFGLDSIGVILTGMGDDGVTGLRKLQAAGGCVIAQDEASSVVFGMPGAAIKAGLPNFVLPLSHVAGKLASLTGGNLGS